MRSLSLFPFIFFMLLSHNSNSQTLAWVKQIYPVNYDIKTSCSDSYLNNSNVICGEFRGNMDFGFSPGVLSEFNSNIEPKVFILKTDFDGNHLWHKIIDEGEITDTRIDNIGNVLVAFRHSSSSLDIDPGPGVVSVSNGSGGYEHIVIKFSSNGDYLWHKIMPIGGSYYMNFELTSTNDIIVTGNFGTSFFYAGQSVECWGIDNSFILEIDETGAENWAKRIGGTSASSLSNSMARELDIDAAGNIFIVGEIEGTIDFDPSGGSTTMSSGSDSKFFLAKYNSTGGFVFVTNQGTTDNGMIYDMAVNSIGEAHLTLDHDPVLGTDQGFTVRKCTVSGMTAWEHIYLNTDINTFAQAIECDASGNTYFSGKFIEDSLDLDPGVGVDYMVNVNQFLNYSKGFVVKIDQNGNYVWSYQLDHNALYSASQAQTNYNNLKMIEPNSLFVTNERQTSTLFKLGVNGSLDVPSGIDVATQSIKLYPNPNNGHFTIDCPAGETNARICDLNGRLIKEFPISQSQNNVSVNLNPGVYLVYVNNEALRVVIK